MTIGRIPSVEGGIQPTIVDAKGDLIAGVAADSINRLAVGTNGTVLTADSSTSTGLAWTGVNQMVNPVINGGMDIWQRGTSSTILSTTAYSADRWQAYRATTGSTVSRQTTSDTTNLPNIQYAARVQRDSGNTATNAIYIAQSIETANSLPFAGKTVTLSFYARAGANFSATSSAMSVQLSTGTGTDQNVVSGYTGAANPISQNVTLTTTWQRFAISATLASTATEMGMLFYFTPTGTASTNDWFEITGVQLDIGTYTASTAPTFRRSGGTIQGELAACQRYFSKSYAVDTAPGDGTRVNSVVAIGVASTSRPVTMIRFPVTMRATPTMTIYAPDSGTSGNLRDVSADANVAANTGIIGDTGSNSVSVFPNGVSTTANNLLAFHWTASIEL